MEDSDSFAGSRDLGDRESWGFGRRSLGQIASIAGESKRKGNGGINVLSQETKIGKRVKVREDHRTENWRGQEGTIAKRWGDPTYSALDVLLDDGRSELFWYHELEEIAERA